MTQELIAALFDRWVGKPILVIGGGPSVTEDLPKIDFEPACVISANDHGDHQRRFKLDLIVSCDQKHCFLHEPMENILRPVAQKHGAALVNTRSWADYRLGDLSYKANTGLTAILVAAALGGHPVVPIGIDFFHGGHRYFHKDGGNKARRPWQLNFMAKRDMKGLLEAAKGAQIRPMSGPLLSFYPRLDNKEVLPDRADVPYRKHLLRQKTVRFCAGRGFSFGTWDRVPAGRELALTPKEAADPRLRAGC